MGERRGYTLDESPGPKWNERQLLAHTFTPRCHSKDTEMGLIAERLWVSCFLSNVSNSAEQPVTQAPLGM